MRTASVPGYAAMSARIGLSSFGANSVRVPSQRSEYAPSNRSHDNDEAGPLSPVTRGRSIRRPRRTAPARRCRGRNVFSGAGYWYSQPASQTPYAKVPTLPGRRTLIKGVYEMSNVRKFDSSFLPQRCIQTLLRRVAYGSSFGLQAPVV